MSAVGLVVRHHRASRASVAVWLAALGFLVAAHAASSAEPVAQPPGHAAELIFVEIASAAPVRARLEARFDGRRQSRTVVRCLLELDPGAAERGPHGYFAVRLAGEVRRDGRPVERFAYRYDVSDAGGARERLALAFDRELRPGSYRLALEVEDLHSGRRYAALDELEVPAVEPAPAPPEPAAAPPAIALVLPAEPILIGGHRIGAAPAGGLAPAAVRFLLDGRPVLTKRRAPFSVELDFGPDAAVRRLAVEALDADGATLARDEHVVNTGQERFALELETPTAERPVREGRAVRARLVAPRGQPVERLDFFLDERPLASFERPPYDRWVALPNGVSPAVVRAVARLDDGRTVEDSALVGGRGLADEIRVRLVELYAAVVDRRGRSVAGLRAEQFRVSEDGRPQRLTRFEPAADLPLHVSVVLDVSHSMSRELEPVSGAASEFLRATLGPRDRANVVLFDQAPRLAVGFTADVDRLAHALTGLRAGGRTALHEALEFALGEFEGVGGARAVLLFSDGRELGARDSTALLEYARRAGVAIYTVGFRLPEQEAAPRELLRRLAEETGGRSVFVHDVAVLREAYGEIQREMRSRYLLAYQSQSSGDGFRVVDVELERSGLEARTVRGYYP
jgi:VWFA-related protein